MHLNTIEQASGSRFQRASGHSGLGRRNALEGDARPGDVLVPAGGALVRDGDENGRVDARDARVDQLVGDAPSARLRGGFVAVQA